MLLLALSACEVKVTRTFTQSKDQKVRADISIIKEALDAYAMAHQGDYPESLEVLATLDDHGHGYLRQPTIPEDPWGQDYGYEPPRPGRPQPRVYTLGRDQSIGGTGDDEDIDYDAIVNGR